MTTLRSSNNPASRALSTLAQSVKKPLVLALSALALSAVALPAAAADWWTTMPKTVTGPASINVRATGALGDGVHDDTAAIQAAINALPATGGTVYVPAGRYMINALKPIRMRSYTRLLMDSMAELDVIPNSSGRYYAIQVWKVTDVRIVGGSIVGDRVGHMGTTGEWGYGINISTANNVVVKQVKLSNFWGDGMWIGCTGWGSTCVPANNVTVAGVTSSNNRRQGLSIGPSQHVYIVNSTFSNSNGTLPEAGLDIEPQTEGPTSTVRIEKSTFSGNHGNGIELHANISDITMTGNTFIQNHGFGVLAVSAPYLTITGNTATQNGLAGMRMSSATHDVSITGNALLSNSTRFVSVTNTGGTLDRDLQIASTTYNISVSNNTYSNAKLDTYSQ